MLTNTPTPQSFVRLEDKYLIPKSFIKDLERLIQMRADMHFEASKKEEYSLESIYFDSSDLDLYQNHFNLLERRCKLRVRSYTSNENKNAKKTYHLELKVKENNISNKERLKISTADYEKLCDGGNIHLCQELALKNTDIEYTLLKERIDRINSEINRYQMRPSYSVTYDRHAYEENDFRITYDDNLCFRRLQNLSLKTASFLKKATFWKRAELMRESFLTHKNIVVELKHKGQLPDWIQLFLKAHPYPKVSFSKYCYAVTESLQNVV